MDEIKKLKQRRTYLNRKVGEGLAKGWAPIKMLAIVKDLHSVEESLTKQGCKFKTYPGDVFKLEYWENKVRLAGKLGRAREKLGDLHSATPIPENERAYYIVKMVYSSKDKIDSDRAQHLMHQYLCDEWSAVEQSIDTTEERDRQVTIYKYRVAGTFEDMQIIESAYNFFRTALRVYEPKVKSEGIWCTKE